MEKQTSPGIAGPSLVLPTRGAPVKTVPESTPASTGEENKPPSHVSAPAARPIPDGVLESRITHRPVQKIPGWVTAEELRQIGAFEATLNSFDAQRKSVAVPILDEAVRAATLAYASSPSEASLSAVREAAISLGLMEKNILPPNIAGMIAAARSRFVSSEIVPFLQAALKRGLAAAQHNLELVTAEESARHANLTGESLGQSGILEAASRPVNKIETWLARLSDKTSDFDVRTQLFPYLRDHATAANAATTSLPPGTTAASLLSATA